jgi:hypothetical protein
MEDQLQALEARLVRAERHARVSRFLAVTAVASLLGLALFAPRPAATARKVTRLRAPVEVVDEQGRTRFALAVGGATASLSLYDTAGRNVARVGNIGPASEVSTVDSNGGPEAWGGGYLTLYHASGKEAVHLSVHPDGTMLQTFDKKGQPLISSVPSAVSSGFSIYNRSGQRAVDVGVMDADGTGRLRLQRDGRPLATLGPDPGGAGELSLYEGDRPTRVRAAPERE